MRKILLQITFLTIAISYFSFPQWSNDPNNNLVVAVGWDPHIASDSAGGCYITYNYGSFYPQKLAVERLDKYGYKPWGDRKQLLGELPEQWQAEIIEDGEGGIIVSYEDNQVVGTDFTSRVRVQKVDSNSNFLWGQTGVRVTTEETNHGIGGLVSDGDGGCIIVWQNYDEPISMNRINSFGERVWGDSGIVLAPTGTSLRIIRAADGNYYVETGEYIFRIRQNGEIMLWESTLEWGLIVATPDGGGILHSSIWNPSFFKLLAQRKDTLGNNLWQEPYVEIADSLYINTQVKIQPNVGYYYYGWSGTRNGLNRVAQFQALRLDGSKLFPEGSISISDRTPLSVAGIIPSESSKAIIIWNDDPNLPDTTLAQIYDTLGNKIWNENGIVIAHPAISYQGYTIDRNGGFIIGGIINEFTVVAQQISRYGNLGEIIPVELISFSGYVEENKVILNWVTATELNNYGFEIQRLQDNKIERLQDLPTGQAGWEMIGFVPGFGTTTETRSYSFIDENVVTGIYKYRLKQIDYDGTFEYSNEIEINFDQPSKYVLEQNYPNPFNSSTIIKYQVPKDERVRINLYNILGEKILTLFEGEQKAGVHQVILSSEELPSGNYFYSLETASTRQIKKLTIIK